VSTPPNRLDDVSTLDLLALPSFSLLERERVEPRHVESLAPLLVAAVEHRRAPAAAVRLLDEDEEERRLARLAFKFKLDDARRVLRKQTLPPALDAILRAELYGIVEEAIEKDKEGEQV
jgi:hypothetical protein